MNKDDKDMLDFVEFVATKFQGSVDGWTYTRDTGELEHIRYKSDRTGRDSFFRRMKWGLSFAWDYNGFPVHKPQFSFSSNDKRNLWQRARGFYAYFLTGFKKENNMPDGVVNNGEIIIYWEEDGEYITMMGPTVGVKVIQFLRANPENDYAKAILAEMRRVHDMSWGKEEEAS